MQITSMIAPEYNSVLLSIALVDVRIPKDLLAKSLSYSRAQQIIALHREILPLLSWPSSKRCDVVGRIGIYRLRLEVVISNAAAAAFSFHSTHAMPGRLVRDHYDQAIEGAGECAPASLRSTVP